MTTRNAAHDKYPGQSVQLVTLMAGAQLLNRTPIDSTENLPAAAAIVSVLDGADDTPAAGRQSSGALFVWKLRGGTQQALMFALQDAEDEAADIIVGGLRPLRAYKPDATQAGRSQAVQWIPHLFDELTVTAGSQTGIAGGLIDASDYWADTIAITKTYRPQPDPERLWGPKDSSDALDPNDSPVAYIFDPRGCEFGFVYVKNDSSAGVKVVEFPF